MARAGGLPSFGRPNAPCAKDPRPLRSAIRRCGTCAGSVRPAERRQSPALAINSLQSDTDRGEQRGFVNLLTGLFGTIRNPLAHNPKVEWPIEEGDALDILTLASLIHRKLDRARKP